MKMTELVEEYLSHRFMREISANGYRSVVKSFLASETINDPNFLLEDLSSLVIARWRDELIHTRKLSLVSYNTYRKHLCAIMRFALAKHYIAQNPFDLVGKAPIPDPLPKSIALSTFDAAMMRLNVESDADTSGVKSLASLQPNWYWHAVLKTLLLTGMRRAQIVGLRWSDIDFQRGLIRLRHETSKNHLEHYIPLFDQLVGDLLRVKRENLRIKRVLRENDQVFDCATFRDLRRYRGRSELSVNDLTNFFRALSRELGIRITPHRIRHTTATELAMSTLDLRSIQKLLGHRSEKTTMTYIRSNVESLREIWNRRIKHSPVSRYVDKPSEIEAH